MFIPRFMEIVTCSGGHIVSDIQKYRHIIELPFLRNESELRNV